MTLDEAIAHCKEKAEELKKEADYLDAPYGMDTSARTDCLECAKEHSQLADWLEELKARREADRWIPVSEKLPEKDGRFLICTSSGDIDTNAFMFGQFTRPYVVAWKHLPEPYDWRTENEC